MSRRGRDLSVPVSPWESTGVGSNSSMGGRVQGWWKNQLRVTLSQHRVAPSPVDRRAASWPLESRGDTEVALGLQRLPSPTRGRPLHLGTAPPTAGGCPWGQHLGAAGGCPWGPLHLGQARQPGDALGGSTSLARAEGPSEGAGHLPHALITQTPRDAVGQRRAGRRVSCLC